MFGKKKDKEQKEDDKGSMLGEAYSWISGWTCSVCSHFHTKPHFAFPGQVDMKKKPNEVGRVKKDREEKDSICDEKHGPIVDKDGKQLPLFCPHCTLQLITVKSGMGGSTS